MNYRMWKKHMDDVFGILSRFTIAALLAVALVSPANAGDSEKAKRIHDRIAGVPPTASVLADMVSALQGTNPECSTFTLTGVDTGAECAAYIAMRDHSFYNVTLKNFAAPWTNRDQSVFVPLNDYIATVIGMIRDDVPLTTCCRGTSPMSVARASSLPRRLPTTTITISSWKPTTLICATSWCLSCSLSSTTYRHGNRWRHDVARGLRSLFHRRYEPRHVPLHDAQSFLQRHGAAARSGTAA